MAGTSHLESWLSASRRLSKSLLRDLHCPITRQHHYSSCERLLPIRSLCVCWDQSLATNRCHVQLHKTHKCLVHIFTLAARRWLFVLRSCLVLVWARLDSLPRLMFTVTVYICLHPLSGILWGSEPANHDGLRTVRTEHVRIFWCEAVTDFLGDDSFT